MVSRCKRLSWKCSKLDTILSENEWRQRVIKSKKTYCNSSKNTQPLTVSFCVWNLTTASSKKHPQPTKKVRQEHYQEGKRRSRQGRRTWWGWPTHQPVPYWIFHGDHGWIQYCSDFAALRKTNRWRIGCCQNLMIVLFYISPQNATFWENNQQIGIFGAPLKRIPRRGWKRNYPY